MIHTQCAATRSLHDEAGYFDFMTIHTILLQKQNSNNGMAQQSSHHITAYSSLPVPQYMFHIPRPHTNVATAVMPSGITTLVILSVLQQIHQPVNQTQPSGTQTNQSCLHQASTHTRSSHERIPLLPGKTSGPVQSETL